ncbi:MAG: FkbM family methyltransferase [Hyphomicrobiales bacterium]|nr:MAG: FkbM family methyltransferase [Hyphomicrobiales bacterium]
MEKKIIKIWRKLERHGRNIRSLPSNVSRILKELREISANLKEIQSACEYLISRSPIDLRLELISGTLDNLKSRAFLVEKQQVELLRQQIELREAVRSLQILFDGHAKSAPGRGNVLLSDERLLTRISLPGHFPNGDPILFVNAYDKLIVPKLAMNGYYELESSYFVARNVKANDHVVDVGANFGYYTVLMGSLVGWKGKVVAFEPEPRMARLLRENALINWIDPCVQIIQAACAENAGGIELYTSQARAANTGTKIPTIGEGFGEDFEFRPFHARSVLIDDALQFLEGRVDFMKMDVEGFEVSALRGARKTIAENPNIKIMMEWSPGQLQANGFELPAVARELMEFGLSCYTLHAGGRPGDVAPMDFRSLPEAGYQNIVLMRSPG